MTQRKKLLFLAILLSITFVLADTAHRAGMALTGRPWRPSDLRYGVERCRSAVSELVPEAGEDTDRQRAAAANRPGTTNELHPYFGFATGRDPFGVLAYFENGKRRQKDFVVLMLGGSVAAGCSLNGKVIEEALAGDPRLDGRRPRVLNWAHAAYKQPQQALVLTYLASLGHVPDAVINLDGFNEVALSNQNAAFGSPESLPSYTHWAPLAAGGTSRAALERLFEMRDAQLSVNRLATWTLRGRLYWSSIVGSFMMARMESERATWARRYERHLEKLAAEQTDLWKKPSEAVPASDDSAIRAGVSTWAECSRTIDTLCRDRGALYLHALQPTLHDEGSKPLTTSEIETGSAPPAWIEGVKVGYPLLREAGRQLAADGIQYVDASDVFAEVEETLYFDSCHFNVAGRIRVMERLAKELLARLPGDASRGDETEQ